MALEIFNNSVFGQYFNFNDAQLFEWTSNVLKKIREKGIVAEYIERNFDESDSDYDGLYEPIIKFFGYLVRLTREFEQFDSNSFLSNQYLLNKGHFVSGNETLDQLAFQITNLLRRRAQRGTVKSIKPATNLNESNGEILNLLNWTDMTIFILGNALSKHNSININNSSPLFRGATGRFDLNVAYEFTEDVQNLDLYPIVNSQYVNIENYNGKRCLHIENVPLGQEAGIGLEDLNKKIIINPNLNYEITFEVAQDITAENLTFGVKCYDVAGDLLNLQSVVDGSPRNYFFETRRLNQADRFYFVRGIIYNKDQGLISTSDATLNIGFGQGLKFPEAAVSIIPYIVMDNNLSNDVDIEEDNFNSGDIEFDISDSNDTDSESIASYDSFPSIYLWNIKVTPSNLDYERAYLNNKNFIDIISSNRNGKYNVDQIKDILRRYFIPYNTSFNVINLPRIIETSDDLSHLLLENGDYLLLESGDKILLEAQ